MTRSLDLLILEDAEPVADRLVGMLSAQDGYRVLPVCASNEAAQKAIPKQRIDIMIADLHLPDGPGTISIRSLRSTQPEALVIVMSVLNDGPSVVEAIRAGAIGYIEKDDPTLGVVQAIEIAQRGQSPMSSSIARHIVRSLHEESAGPAPHEADTTVHLTQRERDVLNAIARGFSNREVADILGISFQTVPVHTRNIYRKLEAHNKSEAVFIARQNGLIL